MQDQNSATIRVTIVDDDRFYLQYLLFKLFLAEFEVRGVENFDELEQLQTEWDSSIYIIQAELAKQDSYAKIKRLVDSDSKGLILLYKDNNIEEKILALELGIDFYLPTSVDERELAACIKTVFRRLNNQTNYQEWILDCRVHELIAPDDRRLLLSVYEFKILKLLASSKNQPVNYENLLNEMGASIVLSSGGRVYTWMKRFRDKLQRFDKSLKIQTWRNRGYSYLGPELKIKSNNY